MTTRKRAKSRQVQRLVRRWSDAEVDAISDVIHTRVQLYNVDGRPANGEMLQEIETALRQETKPNTALTGAASVPSNGGVGGKVG